MLQRFICLITGHYVFVFMLVPVEQDLLTVGSKFNAELQNVSGHVWRFCKDKHTIRMGISELFVSIS